MNRLELIKSMIHQKPEVVAKPTRPRYAGLIVRTGDKPTAYGIGPRLSPVDRVAAWVAQPEERGW